MADENIPTDPFARMMLYAQGWRPGQPLPASATSDAGNTAPDTPADRADTPAPSSKGRGKTASSQLPPASAKELLEGLNDQQHQAVIHSGSPLLVVAGAGSGKTRVLTRRVAYLVRTGQALPGEIIAITFTNKAAREMRERLGHLLGESVRGMWISTFHSACVRILRAEYRAAGLRSTFTIYDSADSRRLVQLVLREFNLDSKRYAPKAIAARISDLKNELITPAEHAAAQAYNPYESVVAQVYERYNERLRQAHALDFDDIISRVVELFDTHPNIAENYRRRFRYVLVDEYQDTNHAQYVLVRHLAGDKGLGLTVVGDSDQSIYAFRGATIRNIEEFEKDFPGATTVLLEQNYRSTQNILSAANAVISANSGRRAKNLWTAAGAGEKIAGYVGDSEHDEASYIAGKIDDLRTEESALTGKRYTYGDMAIFYRTNAQSRALEEVFMRAGIPYQVVGGTKFYERKEIKDAIAYLRVVSNPDDVVSMRRILNVPKRGLGGKAEAMLNEHALRYGISFGQAVDDVLCEVGGPADLDSEAAASSSDEEKSAETPIRPVLGLTPQARRSLISFATMLREVRQLAAEGAPADKIVDAVLDRSGYLAQLRASSDPQDMTRVDNIEEFHAVSHEYVQGNPDGSLEDFLEQISLVADADQIPDHSDGQGQVTMMTVHTAKGLEFPVVFVTGLEDGTFPHARSLSDDGELAEERRLAYVALTRAQERLFISRAVARSSWSTPSMLPASRFLDEIPAELVEWTDDATTSTLGTGSSWSTPWGASSRQAYARADADSSFGSWRNHRIDDEDYAVIGSGKARKPAGRLGPKHKRGSAKAEETSAAAPLSRTPGALASTSGSASSAAPKEATTDKGETYRVGNRVRHAKYGDGVIVGLEGHGKQLVARIDFADSTKRLLLRYISLEVLD